MTSFFSIVFLALCQNENSELKRHCDVQNSDRSQFRDFETKFLSGESHFKLATLQKWRYIAPLRKWSQTRGNSKRYRIINSAISQKGNSQRKVRGRLVLHRNSFSMISLAECTCSERKVVGETLRLCRLLKNCYEWRKVWPLQSFQKTMFREKIGNCDSILWGTWLIRAS